MIPSDVYYKGYILHRTLDSRVAVLERGDKVVYDMTAYTHIFSGYVEAAEYVDKQVVSLRKVERNDK